MIQIEKFWTLIEQSILIKQSKDMNDLGDTLMHLLEKETVKTIVDFHKRLEQLQLELNFHEMRNVAVAMGYGDTNHVFKGFTNWVISLGKEHFKNAKDNPDYLLTIDNPILFVVGRPYNQDLNYVSSGAFYEKKGLDADWDQEIKNYQRPKDHRRNLGLDR